MMAEQTMPWIEQLRPLLTAAAGAGGIGAVLTLLSRVLPSGDRRVDDMRDRRREHVDRIHELEGDLQAMTDRWLKAEAKAVEIKERLVILEAQSSIVRRNIELNEGATTPSKKDAHPQETT